MLRSYNLLENVLIDIEKGIREGRNSGILAEKYALSERHLRRLFNFAFKQSLAGYIRSRKLSASIDDLLKTNSKILDIALEYDFDYEQSYINAFKREFGITPGDLRRSGHIVKIKPPLQLFDENKLPDGLFFVPEIVVMPQFHAVGKKYKIPFRDSMISSSLVEQFFSQEQQNIPNAINPPKFIIITSEAEKGADYFYQMPAIQVKALERIPEGFDSYTFPTSLCARFRFINHNSDKINIHIANEFFKAINDFMDSEEQQYFLERRKVDIVIFDFSDNYGNYRKFEWFAPVVKKTSLKIPPFSPSGIKKTYQQELPALRFIGKKYIETPQSLKVLDLLDNWQLNGWFDKIEKQSAVNYKTFFEGADAYINLVRKDGLSEYWMGMFMPEGTEAPRGYEVIDFPKMKIGVCSVYGKRNEIVNFEAECRTRLTEEGFTSENAKLYFRRFNWRGFFEEDVYGKRLLDYCYPAM